MKTKISINHYIGNELHDFDSNYGYNNEYRLSKQENPTLWRYMDFTKFLSMLDSNTLFFSKPKYFVDPYEGNFSKYDLNHANYLNIFNEKYTLRDYVRELNEYAAVICWHMNEYESAAMWDLYLSAKDGIAIKTNYEKLSASITDRRYSIYTGKVQYIDYGKDMASNNVFETLFYKRYSFSHENEFRMMVFADPISEDGRNLNGWESYTESYDGTTKLDNEGGANISTDISKMIEEIYIAPSAPGWLKPLVESILRKYNLSGIPVKQSNLYKDLVY